MSTSEQQGRRSGKCYRCGRDPGVAHDGAFCPAFADYAEAGTRLSFPAILSAIKVLSTKTVSPQASCRVEEHEGPGDTWHHIVGLSVDGVYAGRFDAPWMPEFSIWSESRQVYDADHGTIAGKTTHKMLYKGWRSALRQVAPAYGIKLSKLGKKLGVNFDRSTEEIRRIQAGYV